MFVVTEFSIDSSILGLPMASPQWSDMNFITSLVLHNIKMPEHSVAANTFTPSGFGPGALIARGRYASFWAF
jgi:hypothetical protein